MWCCLPFDCMLHAVCRVLLPYRQWFCCWLLIADELIVCSIRINWKIQWFVKFSSVWKSIISGLKSWFLLWRFQYQFTENWILSKFSNKFLVFTEIENSNLECVCDEDLDCLRWAVRVYGLHRFIHSDILILNSLVEVSDWFSDIVLFYYDDIFE